MVSRSLNGLIYGFSWYLDEVADDWQALILGNYEAGWPLPIRKKFGLSYCYQPPLCQQLGIFFTRKLEKAEIDLIYRSLPKNIVFFNGNLNSDHLKNERFGKYAPQVNYVLNLDPPFLFLQANFDTVTKRNVKRAVSKGCSVFKADDPWKIIEFYEKHYSTIEGALDKESGQAARRLTRTASNYGYLLAYTVYTSDNQLCAGAIFMVAGTRIIYLMGGTDNEGKQLGAMHFLFSSLIEEYAGNGYLLDFEGSRIPGVARFFRQFGADLRPYFNWRYSRWKPISKYIESKPI